MKRLALAALLLACAHPSGSLSPAGGEGQGEGAPPATPAARPPPLTVTPGALDASGLDASYQPPLLAEEACLAAPVAPDALPPGPGRVLLRFAVAADAGVDDVSVLANTAAAPPATLRALEAAVRACRFIPARDPRGRRVRVYVQLPFQFG